MFSASSSLRRYSFTFNLTLSSLTVFLLGAGALAQQIPQPSDLPDSPVAQQTAPPDDYRQQTVTIPAGTRLALVLTHPLDSKTTRRGDEVYALVSAPVTLGDQVAIPPGTFAQGKVENMHRDGSRAVITMQSASLAFPNGYVAEVRGPLEIVSEEGTAWNNPSSAAKTGILVAPFVGSGIGLGIGSAFHTTQSSTLGGMTISSPTPKGLAIGSFVGLGAGAAVSLVLLARSHHFYMEEGSALRTSLPLPVTLSASQIAANNAAAQSPPPAVVRPQRPVSVAAPVGSGTCYTPGTPGTPGTFIPGTPAIGDSPGTPGTYIPGIPATPPTPYPCP